MAVRFAVEHVVVGWGCKGPRDLVVMAAWGGVYGGLGALIRAIGARHACICVWQVALWRAVLLALGVHPSVPATHITLRSHAACSARNES